MFNHQPPSIPDLLYWSKKKEGKKWLWLISLYQILSQSLNYSSFSSSSSLSTTTCSYVFIAGRASAVSDFVHHPSQTIRWKREQVLPATGGANDAPFIIQITNDEVRETTEYFEVAFTVLVNGYPAPGVARITIIDDDGTVRKLLPYVHTNTHAN